MTKYYNCKGKKKKKVKFKNLSDKRWRKELKKRRNKGSFTQQKRLTRFMKDILCSKPIFKIFEKNSFYKKPLIEKNIAIINIPKVFSFSKNPYDTINIIKEVAYAVKNSYNIFINHEDCIEIDLAASIVMDVILMEYKNVINTVKLKLNLSRSII